MTPVIRPSHSQAWCKARGPEQERGHVHACTGPTHGYDEHPCVCGVWFKTVAAETRVARVPDSARETGAA